MDTAGLFTTSSSTAEVLIVGAERFVYVPADCELGKNQVPTLGYLSKYQAALLKLGSLKLRLSRWFRATKSPSLTEQLKHISKRHVISWAKKCVYLWGFEKAVQDLSEAIY